MHMNENYFKSESEKLLKFIESSPSCFHVVHNVTEDFKNQGFEELYETEKWNLKMGGKYFVTRNHSSVIAFILPDEELNGFNLICSHTDSPTFKIKEQPELVTEKKYTRLNVEKYGGMLIAPWFDRPLSVAGRVLTATENGIEQKLVQIDRDLLMIPNVAIHMNRTVNEGYKYNEQTDLCPLFGDGDAKEGFLAMVACAADVEEKDILGYDLFLYNRQRGSVLGANEEYIASPRLDDLQCLYGSMQGFLSAAPKENAAVFCAFDNEETGSVSRQGAASTFLKDTLRRIHMALGKTEEEYLAATSSSFMISADNAHALHPNHQELADPVNRPLMNGGIVIKYNANQKYTTDAVSTSVFKRICDKAEVPYQIFTNRSDMAGGSTLGNISNTQVSLRAVDIGLAQLAMHSPYEMAGVKDTWYLEQVSREFYSTRIVFTEDGGIRITQ